MESRYLGVLRRLQEIKSLHPAQREAVQKMIEDALKGELKSVTKLSVDRYEHLNSRVDKITDTTYFFLIQESLDMTIKSSEEETLNRSIFSLFTPDLINVLNICCVLRDHDEYGFKIIPDYEVEDMKLLAKIQALEIRSHNLLHQVRETKVYSRLSPPPQQASRACSH